MSADARQETFVADMDVGAPSGLPEGLKGGPSTSTLLSKPHLQHGDSPGSAAFSAARARLQTPEQNKFCAP
ncbi:MAG: hypothetical protein ACAI34_12255, partial [Verrucomicrobium sp.]